MDAASTLTPADNLEDFFVRTRTGLICVVLTDERFDPRGGACLQTQRFAGEPLAPTEDLVVIEPSEVEAIATTAEGARTAPTRFGRR